MEIGVFAKVWEGRPLDDILRVMTQHGIRHTQFNLTCVGHEQMPARIAPELAHGIRRTFERHGVVMSAISGTFNMIDPEREAVADNLRRLAVLAGACRALGTQVITICTGTRDPQDMWRFHPDNSSVAAWNDLVGAMQQALAIAEAEDVYLAIEPEQANVITSAQRARRLIDQLGSPRLKITFDAANLFERAAPAEQERTVSAACDLLRGHIKLAHAKDRDAEGRFVAAGQGVLNYDHYIAELRRVGYDGALVLHGLTPEQVQPCAGFLRRKVSRA